MTLASPLTVQASACRVQTTLYFSTMQTAQSWRQTIYFNTCKSFSSLDSFGRITLSLRSANVQWQGLLPLGTLPDRQSQSMHVRFLHPNLGSCPWPYSPLFSEYSFSTWVLLPWAHSSWPLFSWSGTSS